MMAMVTCLLLIGLVLLIIVQGIDDSNVSPAEFAALYDLYTATNGSDWQWWNGQDTIEPRIPWNFSVENANPCKDEWEGIICNCVLSPCRITHLGLRRHRLVGKIPASLANLSELLVLDLAFNFLHGHPTNFFNLTKLTNFDMSTNYFSGTIPSEVCQFEGLNALDLSSNHFNGSVPDCIGRLQNLHLLRLSFNRLTGTFPSSMSGLESLVALDVNINSFHGNMSVLTTMTELISIQMGHNQITGPIPATINNLKKLRILVLEGNHLEGSLIDELWTMKELIYLSLGGNNLNGTVPDEIRQLTNLRALNLSYNDFAGSFPMVLWEMTMHNLTKIDMAYAKLVGNIDDVLVNQSTSKLTDFDLFGNSFTGTIPEVMELKHLRYFDVGFNYLTGTIPESICNASSMRFLFLNSNQFFSTVPHCFNNMSLQELSISGNALTGTAPAFVSYAFAESKSVNGTHDVQIGNNQSNGGLYNIGQNLFTGTITERLCLNNFHMINVGNNFLHGTLPSCLFNITKVALREPEFNPTVYNTSNLRTLNVSYNFLDGTLPPEIGHCYLMTTIAVNHNAFSGSIPDLSNMFQLVFLYAQRNQLTGPMVLNKPTIDGENYFGVKNSISFVDVSENQLSGTLPELLFQSSVPLLSFAAASNCFTGTISESICNLPSLIFLDLDGISTATSCQRKIFPFSNVLTAFLTHPVDGGIPSCLFRMPHLRTLHVSGNSLEWSFPQGLTVSDSLTYLDLSHNKISGTIPSAIQQRSWLDLDLSYNRLTGFLEGGSPVPANGSLTFKVNRLTGPIPKALLDAKDINILAGNVFYCDLQRNGLPKNDPAYSNYQCGSNSFNQSAVIWSICAFCTVLAVYIVVNPKYLPQNALINHWRMVYRRWKLYWHNVVSDNQFASFTAFIRTINRYVYVGLCIVILVVLPINMTLSYLYGVQSSQYAWVVAAVYISGFAPAMVLTFTYITLVVVLYVFWERLNQQRRQYETVARHKDFVSVYQTISLCLVVVANSIITCAVNGGYVYIILTKDSTVVSISQVSIAMFKLVWNEYAVQYLIKLSRKMYQHLMNANSPTFLEYRTSQEMPFLTYMAMFNSLVAPFLASAVVDPNCFRGVFVQSPTVTSTFPYVDCNYFQVEDTVCSPQTSSTASVSVTYDPPFIYSYQCMSSMMTNYTSVYVIMFLLAIFIKPPIVRLGVFGYNRLPKSWLLYRWISYWLNSLHKPADLADISSHKIMFRKEKLVLRFVTLTAVLLTFGVLFPPLAVIICGSYFTESLLGVTSVGRFLNKIQDPIVRGLFKETLIQNSENCWGLFLDPMVRLVVPFATLFYALIVFDIYGDVVGAAKACWMSALIIASPYVLYAGRKAILLWSTGNGNDSQRNVSRRLESVETVKSGRRTGSVEVDAKRTRSTILELRDLENPLQRSVSQEQRTRMGSTTLSV